MSVTSETWLAGFRAHRDGDLTCPHGYGKGDHHWESGDCLAAAFGSIDTDNGLTLKQCGWCSEFGHTTDEHNAVKPEDPRCPASEPEVWGGGCECWVTPESSWLSAASCGYGSGYEPGSQVEFNPDCPKHGRPTTAPAHSQPETGADAGEGA